MAPKIVNMLPPLSYRNERGYFDVLMLALTLPLYVQNHNPPCCREEYALR